MPAGTALADLLRSRGHGARTVLGIAGAPGAGKSTLAEAVAEQALAQGHSAVVVPMDGFHLAQRVLDAQGLAAVKGAPETFDAAGFVALLRRLREASPDVVWAPAYERSVEEPIAGAIAVPPSTTLIVTEGNYLLLADGAWARVRAQLDAAWYLEPPSEDVRRDRLITRHRSYGESAPRARERALGSDERNARLVHSTRHRADVIVASSSIAVGGSVQPRPEGPRPAKGRTHPAGPTEGDQA